MDDSKKNIVRLSRRFVSQFFVLSLFAFVVLASALAAPQSVHAGGGIGTGGSGRGGGGSRGSGYPNTGNGYGWYTFRTDGSNGAPGSMRNGDSWTDVVSNCVSQNAKSIIAFIILRPDKLISTSMVYDLQNQYSTADTSKYRGNNGYPWVRYTDAYNAYLYTVTVLAAQGVDTSPYSYWGDNGNVAWFCADFQAPPWDVSPYVSVDKSTAAPGDTITWTHSVTNNGKSPTTDIKYGYSSDNLQFGPTIINYPDNNTSISTSTHLVTQADVGTNVCRSTYATPRSSTDNGIIASGASCVSVPYNYALTPTITTTRTSTASVGASIGFTPHVTNSGPTKSQAVDWQVTGFVVSPGSTPPDGGVSPGVPCSFYKSNVTSCTSPLKDGSGNDVKGNTIFDGSATGRVTNSTTDLTGANYTVPDLPVGSRVCFAQSVKPNSSSDVNWRHSTPICVVVSKSPLVHVLGGDLRVGATFAGSDPLVSQITTSVTIKTDKSYGSWDEYAIAASGSITGMASGSAYRDGLSCTANCATNNLTFANFNKLGNFKPTTPIPDVGASFPVTTSTLPFSSLADAVNRRVETASSPGADIKIDGGTIANRSWLVINAPTSTVTITGDITYDSSALQNIADIPQLVIIANKINIEGNVGKVDAWLIASGSVGAINTCSAWKNSPVALSDKLSSDICSDPLVINGPVMAKTLYLRRTAGADNGPDKSDNPAEVINLRPDAYLWGLARVGQSGRLTTVYETELPPRF